MNPWDIALLLTVSLQATAIAYLRAPRAKALLITFPFPFSLAFMALGRPVDATNMLGLALLLLFMHAVRWFYKGLGRHIILAIVCAALLYGLAGSAIAAIIPRTLSTFWIAAAFIITLALTILRIQPHREEPPHRSPLPVWLKVPLIMGIITLLILAKQWLHGFMTVFPMVGVMAAYEARHSLWTMTRQIPIVMLTLGPMIIAIHLSQPSMPPTHALAVGWIAFAAALAICTIGRNNKIKVMHEKLDH